MGSGARSVVLLGVVCGCGCGGGEGQLSGVRLDHDAVTIATYQDATPAPVQVAFTYFGDQGFGAGADASWLQTRVVSNEGGVAVVALTADVTKVPLGTVQTTVHFAAIATSPTFSGHADLPVTFTVWAPFAVAHDGVELATTLDGAIDDPHASLAVTGAQSRWRTGYLAKAGTTWTYHAKLTVDSTFLASDTGVLYAAGTDPGGHPVVGELSKGGT